MKTTIRNNITDLPYSLHDAVVTGIEVEEDRVTFRFAEGFFEPSENDCIRVGGRVEFTGVDYDFCNAYVLNGAKNEGRFRGRKMPLEAFAKKYFGKTLQCSKADKTPHQSFCGDNAAKIQLPLKGKPEKVRFEIISETYGYNKSTFSGWLWVKNKLKECILELYHVGDMMYLVEE